MSHALAGRPTAFERLAMRHRLTLVVAGAGWGKSAALRVLAAAGSPCIEVRRPAGGWTPFTLARALVDGIAAHSDADLGEVLPAYPTAILVGFFYFLTITSLSTVLQTRLDNSNRGRVMALWIMGFGGTVPLGVLVAGWAENFVSITTVVLVGSIWAIVLAIWSDAGRLRKKGAIDG